MESLFCLQRKFFHVQMSQMVTRQRLLMTFLDETRHLGANIWTRAIWARGQLGAVPFGRWAFGRSAIWAQGHLGAVPLERKVIWARNTFASILRWFFKF